jgi:hypothetical protein
MTEQEIRALLLASEADQESAIKFTNKLLRDWMRKNTIEGMNIAQSLWIFSRFEEYTIQIAGQTKTVDLFKMFASGAIPTLYYCLLKVQPDPMTESYHWLTQERLDWVKNEVENWLGPQTTNFIKSMP